MAFSLGCTPSEKKADVPPPVKAPSAQAAATSAQPETSKEIVEGYEHTLVTAPDKARATQGKLDKDAVQTAIRDFQLDNGRYPSSLDEVKGKVPGMDVGKFNYDPNTGTVTLKRP